ncbi:MAG TPA: ATP-binding protein, partial [Anaerolineales bacterium]
MIQSVLETSEEQIKAQKVTIHTSSDLPTVYGDRARLQEVFQNLIDNAAKYMGPQPNPTIEIGVRSNQNRKVIFFSDNGIGIPSEYHSRIFGLFEKLDP